jgi:hypothetical protein
MFDEKEEYIVLEKSSVGFYLATKTLIKKDKEVKNHYDDNFSCYLFPIINCASLSCELKLKALSKKETGGYKHIHDLYILFNKLKDNTKNRIIDETLESYFVNNKEYNNIDNKTFFDRLLKSIKDSFKFSRYIHEQNLKGDIDFLIALMFVLNDEKKSYKDFINKYK